MKSVTSSSILLLACLWAQRASATSGVAFHFSWKICLSQFGHFLPPVETSSYGFGRSWKDRVSKIKSDFLSGQGEWNSWNSVLVEVWYLDIPTNGGVFMNLSKQLWWKMWEQYTYSTYLGCRMSCVTCEGGFIPKELLKRAHSNNLLNQWGNPYKLTFR